MSLRNLRANFMADIAQLGERQTEDLNYFEKACGTEFCYIIFLPISISTNKIFAMIF